MNTFRLDAARLRDGGVPARNPERQATVRRALRTIPALALVALLFAGSALHAAEAGKLVAPVYPGAVPAVTGKAKGGKPHPCEGRCFLTRDPIEKVKAFYEKAVGPLKQAPQPYGQRSYGILLEYANRSEAGSESSAVGIHSLGPALTSPTDPAKRRRAYEMGSLGWNAAWAPIHQLVYMVAWTPDMEDPLMYPYKIGDVDALAKKHSRTQTYFYVTDAATGHDRAHALSEQFTAQFGKLKQDTMMGNLAAQQSIAQSAGREGDKIAAQDAQDDPEFNRIMQRKPALNRQYTALAQKAQQQMMAGNMEEAEKTMDESDRLLRSDPEMATLMKRYDERDRQREAVGTGAKAQGQAAETDLYKQSSKKSWNLAAQTLEKAAKEGYVTYIVIDYRLGGKGVERDRAKLAAMDDGLHAPPLELDAQMRAYRLTAQEQGIVPAGDSPEKVAAAREANKPAGSSSAKASASAASASGGGSTASSPAAQQPAQAPAEQKPSTTEQAKSGLKKLKKLF
jgi:hypothetical protein